MRQQFRRQKKTVRQRFKCLIDTPAGDRVLRYVQAILHLPLPLHKELSQRNHQQERQHGGGGDREQEAEAGGPGHFSGPGSQGSQVLWSL